MSDDHTNPCCCCDATTALAPCAPKNRPGLATLAYRRGTHTQFKAAMLAAIAARSRLAKLTTREDDDPAIALLDGWATVLDVLTFYQERIANEGYLGTAIERRSVLELARSIGYELRPGVAASAYLVFALETAEESPRQAKIPKGAKVQSVPGQDEKPQLFETIEEIDARAEWNEMRPRLRKLEEPGFGDTQTTLKGAATNLKPGDALLFVGTEREKNPYAEHWDFRRVTKVEPISTGNAETDFTIVTWDRPLGKLQPHGPVASEARVFALRQRAALFGHNAPEWRSLPRKTQNNFLSADQKSDWPKDWPGFDMSSLANQGLLGEYFHTSDFTGVPQLRVDSGVYLTGATPGPTAPPGVGSIRWTGLLRIDPSGSDTLKIVENGGFRLWLDGELRTGNVHLDAGPYDFRLEFRPAGPAAIELEWLSGGVAASLRVPMIQLDAMYPKVQAGTWVVLSQPLYQELYRVEEAVEDSPSQFLLTSKTTRLVLRGENLARFNDQLRQTTVFAESEELALAETPIETPVFGQDLALDRPVAAPAKRQRLIVSGRRVFARVSKRTVVEFIPESGSPRSVTLESGQTWRVAAQTVPAGSAGLTWSLVDDSGAVGSVIVDKGVLEWVEEETSTLEVATVEPATALGTAAAGETTTSIHLTEMLQHSYVRASVRIFGNVALATHGETQSEVLGSGDAGRIFQEFELKQRPLTHVPAANADGEESTLEVRVDDVLWREVPSLFGLGPKDRCYVTRQADDGRTAVRFGDGCTGARPATGMENLRATYRVGLGLAGVLKAGQLSLLMTRPLGVKGVANPLPSAGGDDPEPRDQARQNAPFTVRTLDRIVSLLDFEDFARTFAGIGKAQADWVWSGSRRVVFLTVAGPGGTAQRDDLPPLTNLREAVQAAREPTQPAQVGIWTPLTFKLRAKLLRVDGYLQDKVYAAVRAALLEAFSFERRAFGQGVAKSEVLAAIQGVEGVEAVDLDMLDFGDSTSEPQTFLPARSARWDTTEGRILPAELLALKAEGIELKEMPV
ncbi:MAG: putative baseplate assembly protein [Phycisphaerales bacterium]